jgi:hypothetical protein
VNIINLSENAGNTMLDALATMMDGGSIELLSDTQRILAVMKLSNPAAKDAIGGELEFNKITEEDSAPFQGTAMTARIMAANGSEVFTCDVGEESSDAVVKLNTIKIFRGGPVRIKSFRLKVP